MQYTNEATAAPTTEDCSRREITWKIRRASEKDLESAIKRQKWKHAAVPMNRATDVRQRGRGRRLPVRILAPNRALLGRSPDRLIFYIPPIMRRHAAAHHSPVKCRFLLLSG